MLTGTKKTILFTLLDKDIDTENVRGKVRGTDYSVLWLPKSYVITWKRENTAQSYHTAINERKLREQYKDRVACLCNHEKGNYKIVSVDEE